MPDNTSTINTDNDPIALDGERARLFDTLYSLSDAVKNETARWAQTIPYHINLLDIWCPGEVDHSRMLLKLLKFKAPDGRFELLESLIGYINEQFGKTFDIVVKNPQITAEKDKIDVCIQEREKYAVIIENKSNWAGDQSNQLARYIIKLRAAYREDQIYVLYLPPYSSKEPDPQSWVDPANPAINFRNSFHSRYVNFSFYDGVIPWLKQKVLPNIRNKDSYLLSALTQYVDHWDGRSGLRTGDKEKNMSVENIIRKKLALTGQKDVVNAQTFQDINLLAERAKEFGIVLNEMNSLMEGMQLSIKQCRKKATLNFLKALVGELAHEGFVPRIREGKELESPVATYCDDNKTGGWGVFEIHFNDMPFPFAFHLGNHWLDRGMGANYYYGFKNRIEEKPELPKDTIMKAFEVGEPSSYWCHYQTSIKYVENFYHMEWQGFEFWADENKYKEFIHGLALEIRDYINRFRQIYLLSIEQLQPTTEQQP